jgi:hypothetical protein
MAATIRSLVQSPVLRRRKALDVVDAGDRIVDQQAQRQDQRKQGDAVDGVAESQIERQRDAVADRHGQPDDHRFAKAQEHADENHHGEDGEASSEAQAVDLLVRRFAVIAQHLDVDFGGQQQFPQAAIRA